MVTISSTHTYSPWPTTRCFEPLTTLTQDSLVNTPFAFSSFDGQVPVLLRVEKPGSGVRVRKSTEKFPYCVCASTSSRFVVSDGDFFVGEVGTELEGERCWHRDSSAGCAGRAHVFSPDAE